MQDFSSQVPQCDIDAADGRHVGLVGVLQAHHLVIQLADIERIGADEDAFEPLQVGPGCRPVGACLADTDHAGIGLDAHQTLTGSLAELYGF